MKYFAIAYYSALEQFAYFYTFLLWAIRSSLSLCMVFFLWKALFVHERNLFGYSSQEMLTYILISTVISALVLTTRTHAIAGEIVQGTITSMLLRPVSFFRWMLAREGADKSIGLAIAIVQVIVVTIMLHAQFVLSQSLMVYLVTLLLILLGLLVGFFLSLIVALFAFWSVEVWAPRFMFTMLILFLSGTYFPLDILPNNLFTMLMFTPFPYLFYAPTTTYIHGITAMTPWYFFGALIWAVILYMTVRALWRKAMKEFTFYGT